MDGIGRGVFLCYDRLDEDEMQRFLAQFDPEGTTYVVGATQEITRCAAAFLGDQAAVAACLRQGHLATTGITLVLIGARTWACKDVDWGLRASLAPGVDGLPNGLLGVVLPSAGPRPLAPRRLRGNLAIEGEVDSYARWYWYPDSVAELAEWIDDASRARAERHHLLRTAPGQPAHRCRGPQRENRRVAEDTSAYVLR
ncbi:MAG: TIR domain-containing protein [Anaerolineae bacterium]